MNALPPTPTAPPGPDHGRPSYKKDTQVDGHGDVFIYFWGGDERDQVDGSGWWFGSQIGGDQVSAFHPSKTATSPPTCGCEAPAGVPVDHTFIIEKAADCAQRIPQTPQVDRSRDWPLTPDGPLAALTPSRQARQDACDSDDNWGQCNNYAEKEDNTCDVCGCACTQVLYEFRCNGAQ